MKSKVRVAVWGFGHHARGKIVPAILKSEQVELAGVSTRDIAARAVIVRDFHCAAWSDPTEMLSDPAVDAVYVATATGLHHAQGVQVLEAGKHLWCEKSLSTNGEQALDLVARGRARGLAVCEAFMYAHHPQLAAIRALIAAETFGAPLSMTCRFGIPHQDRNGFRYAKALGGGALLDLGCYAIHLTLALFEGELAIDSCHLGSSEGYEVDLEGHVVLVSSTGARVVLEWGYGRAYRNEVLVWGRTESLYCDRVFSKPPNLATSISVRGITGDPHTVEVPAADSFALLLVALAETTRDAASRSREWETAERQARHLVAINAQL